MDLYSVYLPTGPGSHRAARTAIARTLAGVMAPRSHTLSVIMGDFNYVLENEDRWTRESGAWSGHHDKQEAKEWEDSLWKPYGFSELFQPNFTHCNGLARFRIDRAYANHHLSDQLDREYASYVLPSSSLSDHKALAFARQIPHQDGPREMSIAEDIIWKPDFAHRVAVEFQELQAQDSLPATAIRRLVLIKRAMHTVAANMRKEEQISDLDGSDDQVGWILAFVRAAEKVNLRRMRVCARHCPTS